MQRQSRPLAVAREARREALGEEPLESAQRARERFAFDEQQRLVRQRCRVGDGKLSCARDEGGEDLDVARDSVRGVEPGRRDGMKARSVVINTQRTAYRARRVGEGAHRGLDVCVQENPRAQAFAGHWFVAMQREVGDHLNAPASQGRRKGLHNSYDGGVGAQHLHA